MNSQENSPSRAVEGLTGAALVQHTPTPWTHSRDGAPQFNNECEIIEGADGTQIVYLRMHRPADARHIVQCVNAHDGLVAERDALKREVERLTRGQKGLGECVHNMVVANQSAWIEWQHGKGAEAAMEWVHNGLVGPGHIPDESAPYGKEAQAWYDENNANPMPRCFCGRPSNQGSMSRAFCSDAHRIEGKEKAAAQSPSTALAGDQGQDEKSLNSEHTCDTCEGKGTIDMTLGGEHFSDPKAECPDCDGKGWILLNSGVDQQGSASA